MTKSKILAAFFLLWGLAFARQHASAAVLYPFASFTDVPLNDAAIVELRFDSGGENVNAVESSLLYDPEVLELVNVSHENSFLTLWTEAPRNSNRGQVTFSGGRPDGSIVSAGNVLTVAFRTLRTGKTLLAVQQSASGVYLNDGYATPVPVSVKSLELNVINHTALLSQPNSPNNALNGTWTSNRTFFVRWTPQPDVLVSYHMSRDPQDVPDNIPEEQTGSATYPSLVDGNWYYSFKEKIVGQDWSTPIHWVIRIDGTPPEPFEIVMLQEAGKTIATFAPIDAVSGISRQHVTVERKHWLMPIAVVTEQHDVDGSFEISRPFEATRITVDAYDFAGNVRTTSTQISTTSGMRTLLITVIFIVGIVGLILLLIINQRKTRRKARSIP